MNATKAQFIFLFFHNAEYLPIFTSSFFILFSPSIYSFAMPEFYPCAITASSSSFGKNGYMSSMGGDTILPSSSTLEDNLGVKI